MPSSDSKWPLVSWLSWPSVSFGEGMYLSNAIMNLLMVLKMQDQLELSGKISHYGEEAEEN